MLSVLRSFLAASVVDVPAAADAAPGTLAGGPAERLTDSEARILRYLPTHLTARDIASELFLSVHTVGTHTRHLYAKLGVHSRQEAVDRGRALGLLAPGIARDPADGPPRDLPGGRLIFRLPGDELQDASGRQVLRVTRRAAAPVRRPSPRRDAPSPRE